MWSRTSSFKKICIFGCCGICTLNYIFLTYNNNKKSSRDFRNNLLVDKTIENKTDSISSIILPFNPLSQSPSNSPHISFYKSNHNYINANCNYKGINID